MDDNPDTASMLGMLVELDGHRAQAVLDGPTALAVVQDDPPDLVLCDIGMPEMDGYAVAQGIRSLPGAEKITLAAITGYGQAESVELTRAAGFDYHFVKPLDPRTIEAFLRDQARMR